MKTVSLASIAALAVGAAANECNADNCLRALRATQTPGRLQSAQAFCSAYTATPPASVAIPSYAAKACVGNHVGPLAVRLSSACSCIAPSTTSAATTVTSTAAPTSSTAPSATEEPCAIASSAWAAVQSSNPSAGVSIPAELAYNCLRSVPLHRDAAVQLVDAIEPYLEWQSDAAYKADPPADYFYPPYDIFEALAQVRSDLVNDVYDSEYAFQIDLYLKVFGQGHDGHFVFYPDLLSKAFVYTRPRSLVSVADTASGSTLPVIKVYEDVVANPETASAVVLINGIDATTYIQNTIFTASFNQDPDAAYNSMFFSKAVFGAGEGTGYFSAGGRIRFNYQGPTTTFTFANGTEATFTNTASVLASLSGITDGESMFQKFCSGANKFHAANQAVSSAAPSPYAPTSSSASPSASPTGTTSGGVTVPGFPKPVDITDDAIVSCYFLDGPSFEDVAVLSVLAFESESPSEFQAVQRNCIAQARAAGKKKIVVDFSANGGGYILQGYDFFRQFFPQVVQDGFSRWKANEAFVALAHIISDDVATLDPYTSDNADLIGEYETWFDTRYDLDVHDEPFKSFADKFGPYVFQDTNYTALTRWNLDDPLTTTNDTYGMGMEISGYGTLANLTQPYAADDIVLLYDGFCASTCTLASEMLRIQGGVRSIAMGGRPRAGPIQGVGGIKGAQTLAFNDVYGYASAGAAQAENDAQKAALARYSQLPVLRSSSAALNTRDQILRGNVQDGLPAQFVVEEADCRLYWTAAMATDVTAVWKAAAQAAFNEGACAAGFIAQSTKQPPSSTKSKRAAAAEALEKRRWTAASEASLAHRQAVAAVKAQGLLGRRGAAAKDVQRFNAKYNQKAVE
ncbi:hypothetical protein HMPREF1624_02957 [Sporothrix schenckii ATCC 58251]|uniref:CPAF-like PDZ domain-containing protein n=1 Tax=Sporothrix schenckii (strain ATCC 58251 / de Perez 2211183) TaxID=1391915 RepID=U7Q1G7_SPOS1|nr:hypothetical protein HMPREF1624_02957 [Sporothrix schenckii ATCC 58251]